MLNRNMRRKMFAQAVDDGPHMHIDFTRNCRLGTIGTGAIAAVGNRLGKLLRRAHCELPADDLIRHQQLCGMILDRKHRLGMTHRQPALRDEQLHIGVQIKQTHGIGHTRPRLAHTRRDFILLHRKLLRQPHITRSLFHRIEILALQVLNQSHLEHITIRCLSLDHRHRRQSQLARRTPATLTSNQLKLATDRTHDQRLDDPMLTNRFDQLVERRFDEMRARLQRTRHHLVMRHITHALDVTTRSIRFQHGSRRTFFDQCSKSFSECLLCHGEEIPMQCRRGFQADFSALRQQLAEILDGRIQTILERNLRLPTQIRLGQRNVRTTLLGIISRQRQVRHL